jgi:hypothetical protein
MLCLFYENGLLVATEIEPRDKLIINVLSQKHMLYLDDEENELLYERDYEVLNQTYKVMHELRGLERCANDAYVSKITKEYEVLYKGQTIYSWVKEKLRELKKTI